jgi:hypothetical protein
VLLLVCEQRAFFTASNIFDAAVVLLSLGGMVFTQSANFSFLRIGRLLNFVRGLQVIETTPSFAQLRVLVRTIWSSLLSLVWSLVILSILMVMGALVTTSLLQSQILDEQLDEAVRIWIWQRYGSSSRALYTMFEVTFSGGWPAAARNLIEHVSAAWSLFWVVYVSTVIFAIVRIIGALFLKDTLANAANDADMAIADQLSKKASLVRKLEDLLTQMDSGGDGNISFQEFSELLSSPRAAAYFRLLDLQVWDIQSIWELLDNGDGSLTRDEFVSGVMQIKGFGRQQDSSLLVKQNREILAQLKDVRSRLRGDEVSMLV